jgi:hypothetical protein
LLPFAIFCLPSPSTSRNTFPYPPLSLFYSVSILRRAHVHTLKGFGRHAPQLAADGADAGKRHEGLGHDLLGGLDDEDLEKGPGRERKWKK